MIRLLALLALIVAVLPAQAAVPGCAVPDDLALTDMVLPHVRAAISARHELTILAIGGSATAGRAAQGPDYSYPSRLAVHLHAQLAGVTLNVINRGQPGGVTRARVERLAGDLAQTRPDLVIWAPGASDAGRSEDLSTFVDSLDEGVSKIRAARADLIMIDLQYAPSIARLIDLARYNDAIAGVADTADAPLLRRSELMRRWNDDGTLSLDDTPPAERVAAIRRLFDCLAVALADGIAAAAK